MSGSSRSVQSGGTGDTTGEGWRGVRAGLRRHGASRTRTGNLLGAIRATKSAERGDEDRDASRLLADASLIVQRTAGVVAEPLLASPGRQGVFALAEGAGLLVVGLSDRWREEGLGRIRGALAASPPAPTILLRRGTRPGGLAPVETHTPFGWSLTRPAR
jgi:hypothetical protein